MFSQIEKEYAELISLQNDDENEADDPADETADHATDDPADDTSEQQADDPEAAEQKLLRIQSWQSITAYLLTMLLTIPAKKMFQIPQGNKT